MDNKNNSNSGTLYIVGTPIGNLGDISPRAIETLKSVDFIAAEDTRVSLKLLTHFNVKKPLISCHKHNIAARANEITERLLNGDNCAVISDAGMPCVSDPGEELVRMAAENGINVVTVPGPCALISAITVSGFSTSRFSFEGFLSVTSKQRKKHLEEIKAYPYTLIFYEAPHKLKYTLQDLLDILGDRKIALCRELTKLHEEVLRGNISDMISLYEEKQPKGEYVLVVEGYNGGGEKKFNIEDAAKIAEKFIQDGEKQSEACKKAAEISGLKKSDIYKYLIENDGLNKHSQ